MTRIRLILLTVGLIGLASVWGLSLLSKHIEHVAAGVRPLEPRSFGLLEMVVLGTGSDTSNHLLRGPSVAIASRQDLVLIDAGRGVTAALRRAEIPVDQVAVVLLTSLLPENTEGLDELLVHRALSPEAPSLQIRGPEGTEKLVGGLWTAHAAGLKARAAMRGRLLRTPAVQGLARGEQNIGRLRFEVLASTSEPLPTVAYKFAYDGRTILVSSRAFEVEKLAKFGADADLWIHEALVRSSVTAALEEGVDDPEQLEKTASYHTALEDIGALAQRMRVKRLILTRLIPPPVFGFEYERVVKEDFLGAVEVAEEGASYTP